MKFEYRIYVEGKGFTYCRNGIDLDTLVRSELERGINWSRITITIEPLAEVAKVIIVKPERKSSRDILPK